MDGRPDWGCGVSDAQGAKAISAVTDGRVVEKAARVFLVDSPSGNNYCVALTGDGARCNCMAAMKNLSCWHVRAARLVAHNDGNAKALALCERATKENR